MSDSFSKRPWFYHFGNWFLRLAFRILLRVELRGLENIPRDGPVVVAISHSSFLDPLIAGAYSPRDVVPMAKIEAFNLPVIGWIIKSYGAFPVRRGEVDMTAVKTALRILQSGQMLVIAPEGHRSENGSLQEGREGAIILSLRSGAPILPVAVWGGKSFWKNLTRFRRTEMKCFVGKPVLPNFQGKITRDQVTGMSHELMLRIAEMMPPELRGYYANWSGPTSGFLKPYEEPARVEKKKEVVHVK
ncbi:MAG: 1-acyl-sn-glycerol-3-phosphate acyltransferase [Chloroflexi bacterium]|nr:1-acyl-sn-glycerol-3-phosphate acyltransferase [Chloroflexota bacterium]